MRRGYLIIPTLKGFTDVFRPTVSKPDSRAFLFNPQDARYQLNDGRLMRDGAVLSLEELSRLAGDVTVNQSIDENVLIYGMFSYLVLKKGLSYHSTVEIGITDISRFFRVTMGKTGFRLFEKLHALQAVYGVWTDSREVFHLLTVERMGKKLMVSSQYMHYVWKAMIATSEDPNNGRPFYFTELAHASLVAERDKVAALLGIEFVRLIVTAGRRRQPNIRFSTLEQYVPQLRVIRESFRPNKLKNRDLKRILSRAYRILESKTELSRTFVDFGTNEVIPKVEQFHEVIKVHHGGYRESNWR